jgi:hypothetical protein
MGRWVLSAGILSFASFAHATVPEDYTLSCRVSGNEAAASLIAERSLVELRGSVRLAVFDWDGRMIEEQVLQADATARPSEIVRIAVLDVSRQASRCTVSASEAKIWLNGTLIQDIAPVATVVEHHHHVHQYPPIVHEHHRLHIGALPPRQTSRVVVVEREAPPLRRVERIVIREPAHRTVERVVIRQPAPRRVEKVIIRQPDRRPRRETSIQVEVPVIRVKS